MAVSPPIWRKRLMDSISSNLGYFYVVQKQQGVADAMIKAGIPTQGVCPTPVRTREKVRQYGPYTWRRCTTRTTMHVVYEYGSHVDVGAQCRGIPRHCLSRGGPACVWGHRFGCIHMHTMLVPRACGAHVGTSCPDALMSSWSRAHAARAPLPS